MLGSEYRMCTCGHRSVGTTHTKDSQEYGQRTGRNYDDYERMKLCIYGEEAKSMELIIRTRDKPSSTQRIWLCLHSPHDSTRIYCESYRGLTNW